MQHDATDCAAACLATVSLYYGLEISISKLRDLCGTDLKGTSVESLNQAALKLNFNTKPVRITIENLNKKLTYPFIVHGITDNGLSHFIVVYKICKKYVIVGDPASKIKKMKKEDFDKFYSGVCVLLKPNSEFAVSSLKTNGLFGKFIKLLTPHKKLFISAIISSVILTLLGIVSNFFNQILIDDILPYNLKNQLTIFAIGFLLISIINIVIGALRQHLLLYLSQKISIPLTLGYFKHIFSLPMKFFSTRKTGEIITRFQDAGTITDIMSSVAISILIDIGLVFGVGIALYFMNPKLFVLIIIMTIINIILVFIFKQPYKKINQITMEQNAMLSSSMIESLQSIELIKTNTLEEERMNLIEKNFIRLTRTNFKTGLLGNVQGTISNSISVLGNLAMMWIGAVLVMDGNITLGALMTFTSMSGMFTDPIGRLVALQFQIQEAGIAMKRLNEIYDVEGETFEKSNLKNLDKDITFKDVEFNYSSNSKVLTKLNLEIKNKQKVAIVGESGCGKTTLAKILFGLYQIDSGEISIGNDNINDIGIYNLRRTISYVSQTSNFFSGTIRENLRCVNPEVSDEYITKSLKFAGCDFVFKKPGGINSYLEEAGANLSGGEKQRLAVARAFCKSFDILILDEATSNLDFLSESKIYNALFNSNLNKTMIIIAHRLSTIRKCDNIIVLKDGNVYEEGTHDELLNKKGHYYDLWMSQIGTDVVINKPKGVEMTYE